MAGVQDPIKCIKCKGTPQVWYKKTKRTIEYWTECYTCGFKTKRYRTKDEAVKAWGEINKKEKKGSE